MDDEKVQITSKIFVLRVIQGLEKGLFGVFPDKRKSGYPHRIPIQVKKQRLGPVENIDPLQAVKEIEREFGPFMIPGNNHHGDAGFGQPTERLNQVIQPLSRDVEFVEKISAVNEQIRITFNGVVYDFHEIPKNGVGPSLPPPTVRRSDLENFKSKMSVCGVNEFQVVTRS
jgi:hypothetical protein